MAKSKASKIVAVYTRVSTDGQKDDSQAHALRQYVANHGITGVKWYRDKISGKDLNRPAMKRLQADIFAGKVSTVLVWKLDRLARNMRDGINLLSDWLDKGVRVVAITQQLDLAGAVGQIVAAVLLGVAQMERENINERIRSGIAARKAKGLSMGRKKGESHLWSPAKRKVDPDVARSLRDKGVKVADIAVKFNCCRQAVYAALR